MRLNITELKADEARELSEKSLNVFAKSYLTQLEKGIREQAVQGKRTYVHLGPRIDEHFNCALERLTKNGFSVKTEQSNWVTITW